MDDHLLYIPKQIQKILVRFQKIQQNPLSDLHKISISRLISPKTTRMSTSNRCAACKCLRRRCPEDCVLAPYFPSTHPQRFACVHKIYGASNLTKMLQHVPDHLRAQAANSLSFEAHLRVQEPVYGCVGFINQLQQEIYITQYELATIQAHLAIHNAQMPPPASQAHDRLQQDSCFGIRNSHFELITATHQSQIAQADHEVGKSELPHVAEQSLAESLQAQVEQGEASCSDASQQDESLHRLHQLLLQSNHK